MTNEERLAALFRKLGANDAESWAHSQVSEGISQLPRFLFLREAWKRVVSDDDHSWMDSEMQGASRHPDAPYAGVGHALRRCLDQGVDREDMNEVVRGMQAQLLFNVCYVLEDPNLLEPEVRDICWALFEVDLEGKPLQHIGGLHESVLQTDPTGREMRPKRGRA